MQGVVAVTSGTGRTATTPCMTSFSALSTNDLIVTLAAAANVANDARLTIGNNDDLTEQDEDRLVEDISDAAEVAAVAADRLASLITGIVAADDPVDPNLGLDPAVTIYIVQRAAILSSEWDALDDDTGGEQGPSDRTLELFDVLQQLDPEHADDLDADDGDTIPA